MTKSWMKDLSPALIERGQNKAVEAKAALHASVDGLLMAAKAVYEVQQQIGGVPFGKFYAWVEEELQRSAETGSVLATVGSRYDILWTTKESLPPALYTLYELARVEDANIILAALSKVTPDTTRAQVKRILLHATDAATPGPVDPWDPRFLTPALRDAVRRITKQVGWFLQPGLPLDDDMELIMTGDRDGIVAQSELEDMCREFVDLRSRVDRCIDARRRRLNGATVGLWVQPREGLLRWPRPHLLFRSRDVIARCGAEPVVQDGTHLTTRNS